MNDALLQYLTKALLLPLELFVKSFFSKTYFNNPLLNWKMLKPLQTELGDATSMPQLSATSRGRIVIDNVEHFCELRSFPRALWIRIDSEILKNNPKFQIS